MSKYWCSHIEYETGQYCPTLTCGESKSPITYICNYCPICGTPRPVEKKVDCPDRFDVMVIPQELYVACYKINQVIDYLKSEPWKS